MPGPPSVPHTGRFAGWDSCGVGLESPLIVQPGQQERRGFLRTRAEVGRVNVDDFMSGQSNKVVYLMRGLPACGKSHRAKRLAGPNGVVLETDEYFYTQVGTDPTSYDYDKELLPAARQWNLNRMRDAITAGISPIVIDRGNGLNSETREFAVCAAENGYAVDLAEPDSSWWQELRVLLKYKEFVADRLFDVWAQRLADSTRDTHRVPASTIRHWMRNWRHDLTVEQILKCADA